MAYIPYFINHQNLQNSLSNLREKVKLLKVFLHFISLCRWPLLLENKKKRHGQKSYFTGTYTVNNLIICKHFPFSYFYIFIIAHFHIKLNVLFHHQGSKKVTLKQEEEKKNQSALYHGPISGSPMLLYSFHHFHFEIFQTPQNRLIK